MRYDAVLNGRALVEQSAMIISNIVREMETYKHDIEIMCEFLENNLEGQAIEAIRTKIKRYVDITRKLIDADEKDIEDLVLLSKRVGDITICGQEIVEAQEIAKNNATNCSDLVQHYKILAEISFFEFEKEYYLNIVEIQRDFENIWNRIFEKWQEQEELYDRIDSETRNLFKQGNEIRNDVLLFINENGFAWNDNEKKTDLVRTVRLEDRTLEGTELLRRCLENQKDGEGNPLYTDEQIDRIIDYMQTNYKNQLDNLSVLNSYCGTEFDKLLNMCLEYSKDYDKILTDAEIRQLLLNCNWNESEITQDVINDLQYTMKKYDINTQKEVCAFLAQCTFETGGGRNTVELGDESYFNGTKYGSKYRGAGYIQLTWKYGYQAFAIYLVLREYPQLKDCVEYKNPAYNSEEIIEDEYCLMIEEAKKRGIDISHYTNIVDIGYSYLAENFAWESAGYFWDINSVNDLIENGGTIDDITTVVNRYDDTYSERASLYYTFIEYSTPMFE